MNRVEEIGEAPIGGLLLKFSLPTIAMMVVNGVYNLVDRIYIGHGMGTEGIAAVTAGFPLMLVAVAVGGLLGVGSSTLISIALGRKRRAEASAVLGQAFSISIASSIAVAAATFALMNPVLVLLGATGGILAGARVYLTIVLIGFLFQIPSMAIGGSLRCQGRPKASLFAVLSGVAVNALLAPLFIFWFHWGLAGAAWATVAGQAVSFAYMLVQVQGRRSILRIRYGELRPSRAVVGRMVVIGMPVGVVNLIQTAVFAVANARVAAYGGGLGIAMVGVVNTVYLLATFPVQGITQGAQALWGYNYGAGRFDRVRKVTGLALAWCTAVSVFFTLMVQLLPRTLVAAFNTSDPRLLSLGAHGLSVFFAGFFLFGLSAVAAQFFQAIGRPGRTTLLLVARNVILIAGMLALPFRYGLDGVLIAGPLSDILTAVLSAALLMMALRRLERPAGRRSALSAAGDARNAGPRAGDNAVVAQ